MDVSKTKQNKQTNKQNSGKIKSFLLIIVTIILQSSLIF
jgi:hypothetical protein